MGVHSILEGLLRWISPDKRACIQRSRAMSFQVRDVYKTSTIGGEEQRVPRQFDVVIERDSDGYYVASVPQLAGCHTQARSLDGITERIREAIELCLEVEGTPEQELEFVGIQRVTVAA
jgi:predicted RNase H-like HicB family nuclease